MLIKAHRSEARSARLFCTDTPEMEAVELLTPAQEAAAPLAEAAVKKNIALSIHGEKSVILGVRRLLREIVYNLCDNAIRYTNEDSSVQVTVRSKTLTVSGIGIAPEHQSRIFERFYRVDKSHSGRSGGTGLGLSIVKHAAAYHKASIELTGAVGEGTSITVHFP